MPEAVVYFLVFLVVGVSFLAVNLIVGRLARTQKSGVEKDRIYECGEVPVGSSWIQFDLRFYVVALLFVIFDVEIAFFFPWAVVFGDAVAQRDAGNATAGSFAQFAFLELIVFFAILLVGFAYLWKRGDLEWVRSTEGQT